jgi:branched-chain amino acid transport system substrate-binding protein
MRYRFFLAALVALAALMPMQQTSLADEAPKAERIVIGTTASLTGRYAEFGREQLQGIQMWVDSINARGALLGRKVKLLHYDDQSKPETSARLYERLITQDGVDLLLGPYASDLNMAASSVAEKHQFPMIATGGAADSIWQRGYANVFGTETPTSAYMDLVLAFAKEKGLQRVALIYANNDFPREVAKWVRTDAAALGLEIVFDEEYDQSSTRFGELIKRMGAADPEVIIAGSYLEDSLAFTRQAKAAGLAPKMLAFTVGPGLRGFGDALGPDAEGVIGIVQWMRSAHLPKAQDFAYRYKRKHGYNAGPHAASGYAAGQVLEAAVRLVGSLDNDKVREQYRTLKGRSVLGHYRVDETGKQVGKPGYVMQWQDGQRRLILPLELAERPVEYPFRP